MRILIILYLWLSTSITSSTTDILDEDKIQNYIQNIENIPNITYTEKKDIINQLKLALQSIAETAYSKKKIQEYQNVINNFSSIIHQLHEEKNNDFITYNHSIQISNSNQLRQNILQINQQLNNLDQELQQEQNILRAINDSVRSLPQQHTQTKKELNETYQQISNISTIKIISYLENAQLLLLHATKEAKKTKITELELAQLSANNRQELSRLRIELLKNKYNQLDHKLQKIHIQLHNTRQQETAETIEEIEKLITKTETGGIFSINIAQQLKINKHLSHSLKEQIEHINLITLQQRQTNSHTLQAKQALSKLLEQAQWIKQSPTLGETLRLQFSELPRRNIYQPQQLNHEMTKLKKQRLEYEEQINKLSLISSQNKKKNEILSNHQTQIFNLQINTQRKLLNSLLTNCDIQILELTKLKIANEQLKDVTKNIEHAIHNYLFWIADIHPINLSCLYKIYQELSLILNTNTLSQLKYAIKTSFNNNQKVSILFVMLLLIIFCTHTIYQYQYYSFLTQSTQKLKNTNNFFSVIKNIFWSIIISSPIPILLIILGYLLSQTWEYPLLSAIGNGITLSAPILWLLTIISYFSSHNGLFVNYFKWNKHTINTARRYHIFFITIIIVLIITITTLNNYNNKEFYDTLGRLFFIVLCIFLTSITYNFKKSNFPIYVNKFNSANNIVNQYLWNIMLYSPILCATASCFGYLSTAQTILIQLETSLLILVVSSVIYYTIRCWIIIQKYKIISKQNKKYIIPINKKNIKKTLLLSPLKSRINTNNTINNITTSVTTKNINKLSNIDLNVIINQSLQLIRLTLIIITFFIILPLWSELHFIYEYLEKITILDITSTIPNTAQIPPITIKTLLTTFLICLITTQCIKYLPSLLILTILQYLNLTPGTNYAILILTKHSIILLSIIINCSYLGIEWSKLQWLIAAISVGLGFGLQEIFANFISGLIILFEKPIRVEDTITIGDLTGHVTQINTRATTITDWDHKEIIIPNKEFITKKFINWSLSNTITRIVLKIPGPPNTNVTKIRHILLEAVKNCQLVLHLPQPEVYLINLEQGIPLFEIRMYTSNIKNRMLLRHQVHMLIIHFYKKYGLQLPFPHIHIN